MSESMPVLTTSQDEATALIRKRKVAMAAAGLSGAAIARQLGITRSTVSSIVRGRHRSLRVRVGFARAVGVPVEELFPVAADIAMIEAAHGAPMESAA